MLALFFAECLVEFEGACAFAAAGFVIVGIPLGACEPDTARYFLDERFALEWLVFMFLRRHFVFSQDRGGLKTKKPLHWLKKLCREMNMKVGLAFRFFSVLCGYVDELEDLLTALASW